jgi:hypothetical protein
MVMMPNVRRRAEGLPEARAESPTVANNNTLWALDKLLTIHAQHVATQHRLRLVHVEDDGSFTFVCVCDEGYSQRENWNDHIAEKYGELE